MPSDIASGKRSISSFSNLSVRPSHHEHKHVICEFLKKYLFDNENTSVCFAREPTREAR